MFKRGLLDSIFYIQRVLIKRYKHTSQLLVDLFDYLKRIQNLKVF